VTLSRRLHEALLAGGDALDELSGEPVGHRDALLTVLAIHDLHVAPIDRLGRRARWQHHPAVARLKSDVEDRLLVQLAALDTQLDLDLPADAVAAMRALAATDLVPPVYDWVADEASYQDLVRFLALEGGPDGGFDDLVAACQIGLTGEPKLELAQNYWDEMGRGSPGDVHTELHHQLVAALDLTALPREEQPTEALERAALGSLLATNRHLQPEMVGALGLIELQAGPRCRKVVRGLERVGAPEGAFAFYREHAVADPRHGKDWVDKVVAPLADDANWATRIVQGARWRSIVNRRFFDAMAERFVERCDTRPDAVA
jgi:hypothetical protein